VGEKAQAMWDIVKPSRRQPNGLPSAPVGMSPATGGTRGKPPERQDKPIAKVIGLSGHSTGASGLLFSQNRANVGRISVVIAVIRQIVGLRNDWVNTPWFGQGLFGEARPKHPPA
jgi:hypothetical protein